MGRSADADNRPQGCESQEYHILSESSRIQDVKMSPFCSDAPQTQGQGHTESSSLGYQQVIYSAYHYCSQRPSSQTRIGIDRINSGGNYEITNCVPCCARCNFMKGSLDCREFVDHARRITFSMRTRDVPYASAPLLEPPFGTPGKRRKRSC